ncbi:hypothetical protein AB1Y20_018374 [Prymnesium parvum]|uniref:RING-type E3 ubiquitin transferase n=1 Tax=Prymnesium parvum TaxID=97485 RepID=A0AB34JS31_PRYPA
MHGRVEVVVELEYIGRHSITLKDQRGQSFPWRVELEGVCPANETTLPTDQCACSAGWYRPTIDDDCVVCASETYKRVVGDQSCTLCIAEDAQRRVTVGSRGEDHDSLADCGCSEGWYLNITSLSPKTVATLCPPSYNTDAWSNQSIKEYLLKYRELCCQGECKDNRELKCAEARCKDDLVLPLVLEGSAWSNSSACTRLYAAFIGIVYVLGIPWLYFVAIWRFRQQLGGVQKVQQFMLTSKDAVLSSAIDKAKPTTSSEARAATLKDMIKKGFEPTSLRLHQKLQQVAQAKVSSGRKKRIVRKIGIDERNSGQPLLAARARAVALFKAWHPRLGIDLDPMSEVPVVRAVWPVAFPHPLSEVEETLGYEAFLKARLAVSRDAESRKAIVQELSQGRERFLRPSRMLGLRGSARGAWEAMTLAERERWVADAARETPQRGYELLFVNGQRALAGTRQGVAFDHSDTYKLLEDAEGGSAQLRWSGDAERGTGRLGSLVFASSSLGRMASSLFTKPGEDSHQEADALNILVVLHRLWTGWAEFVAETDPGMERDESSATFAALQRASGDFLLTSPNWDDDRLAELDDLPEDARGPLIRAFVQDFLNGSDGQPGSASEKSASSRSRGRKRNHMKLAEKSRASAHARAVRRLCIYVDQLEGSAVAKFNAADLAWEAVATSLATAPGLQARPGFLAMTYGQMRSQLESVYEATEADVAQEFSAEASRIADASEVAASALAATLSVEQQRLREAESWIIRLKEERRQALEAQWEQTASQPGPQQSRSHPTASVAALTLGAEFHAFDQREHELLKEVEAHEERIRALSSKLRALHAESRVGREAQDNCNNAISLTERQLHETRNRIAEIEKRLLIAVRARRQHDERAEKKLADVEGRLHDLMLEGNETLELAVQGKFEDRAEALKSGMRAAASSVQKDMLAQDIARRNRRLELDKAVGDLEAELRKHKRLEQLWRRASDATSAFRTYKEVVRIRRRLGLPRPARDEVTLFFKNCATGEAKIFKLHKGLDSSGKKILNPFIPWFIRLLTDDYEIQFKFWEIVECARKMILGGAFIFIANGTTLQLGLGIVCSVLFVMVYNNLKPYAAWQNDVLQQFCQMSIFLTLVAAILQRYIDLESSSDPSIEATSTVQSETTGWLLLSVIFLSVALAILMAIIETRPTLGANLGRIIHTFRITHTADFTYTGPGDACANIHCSLNTIRCPSIGSSVGWRKTVGSLVDWRASI